MARRGAVALKPRTPLLIPVSSPFLIPASPVAALFVAAGTLCVMFTDGPGRNMSTSSIDGGSLSSNLFPQTPLLVSATLSTSMARILTIATVFGFMICVLVFATGSISGGNLNPAVTVALLIAGKMSVLRAVLYVIAQCTGAIAGAAFARSLSPTVFNRVNGAANAVNPALFTSWGGNLWAPFLGEIVGTSLLVFTVSAAADVGRERANKYVGALTPLMIGFSVLVSHMFLIVSRLRLLATSAAPASIIFLFTHTHTLPLSSLSTAAPSTLRGRLAARC